MNRLIYAVSALLLICTAPAARAVDTHAPLRIGLSYGSSASSSVTLDSAGGFSFGAAGGNDFAAVSSVGATRVTITADGTAFSVKDTAGAVVYTSTGQQLALRPSGDTAKLADYDYHGDFVLQQSAGGALTVINYVDPEDYVKGVVPYEMSANWHAEALKAQAVCARSYAFGNLNKHKSQGFDLCNTTHCQVYRGIGRATANSDAAVAATAGQYLLYDGKLATGFFYSSSGGATEDNENVWGGTPLPYLRGVQDIYEDVSSVSTANWSVTLSAAQVAEKLKAAGHSIGTVAAVQVTQRTAMNNVNAVTVTDTSGKAVTITNGSVRTVFGLNSIRYTISDGNDGSTGGGLSVNGQPRADSGLYAVGADGKAVAIGQAAGKTILTGSGKQTLTVSSGTSTPAGSFTFTGTGWGHNVGMSQYGALSMAKLGFSYDEILKFYFTGIEIAGA